MSDSHQETPTHHTEPDSWHRHSEDEGAPQVEHAAHANPTVLAVTFIAMILGVAFVVVVLVAYFNNYVSNFKAEKQEGVGMAAPFEASKAEALAQLNGHGWVDTNTIYIPVDDAMDLVVQRYASASSPSEESMLTDAD